MSGYKLEAEHWHQPASQPGLPLAPLSRHTVHARSNIFQRHTALARFRPGHTANGINSVGWLNLDVVVVYLICQDLIKLAGGRALSRQVARPAAEWKLCANQLGRARVCAS